MVESVPVAWPDSWLVSTVLEVPESPLPWDAEASSGFVSGVDSVVTVGAEVDDEPVLLLDVDEAAGEAASELFMPAVSLGLSLVLDPGAGVGLDLFGMLEFWVEVELDNSPLAVPEPRLSKSAWSSPQAEVESIATLATT